MLLLSTSPSLEHPHGEPVYRGRIRRQDRLPWPSRWWTIATGASTPPLSGKQQPTINLLGELCVVWRYLLWSSSRCPDYEGVGTPFVAQPGARGSTFIGWWVWWPPQVCHPEGALACRACVRQLFGPFPIPTLVGPLQFCPQGS